MKLRFASREDVPALLSIYEHYIPTPVTFEYVLPSIKEFSHQVVSISKTYPYLVLENQGEICGYAYAHRIAERAAYAWGAELSVYLHPYQTRQGFGKRLYCALIELLRLQGVRTVYALVASPNPASEGLHKSLGFHQSGIQKNAGYKNGRWIDLLWLEKAIGPYSLGPAPLIPIHALPPETVQRILEAA